MTDRPTHDETPDEQPGATPGSSASDSSSPDGATPAARPRPAAPGVAAARRARQLGGTRRPSPRSGPTAADSAGTDTASPAASTTTAPAALTKPAKPAKPTKSAPTTTPKSSVGKAAARPRPRPTPAPVDAAADEATGTDDDTAKAPRRGLLVGAALLTVLFLAAGVVFLVLTLTATPQLSTEETSRAVSAAKTDVALLTTYGYQTIDTDAAKAADVITGQFKQQYLDAVKTSVKPQLPSTQAVTTGQVDTAGLVSADAKGRQVVVLVYGQQSVTNKEQTTPRIDAFQVRVTMQRVDGRWLVSALEQLGNNA